MEAKRLKFESAKPSFIIRPLLRANPWIYWGDLLGSAAAAYGLMYVSMGYAFNSPFRWIYFILAGFFVNRGLYFMHEVVHQSKNLKGFKIAQNLLFGFVFKYPVYIHEPHHHHHRASSYGTDQDPEYDSEWIRKGVWHYLIAIPLALLFPCIQMVRFGLLPAFYPLMPKKARLSIYRHASTFALNPNYKRPLPSPAETKEWLFQDLACASFNILALSLVLAGHFSIENFLTLQLFSSFFFFCNFFRALVAHRYSSEGEKMSFENQIKDSISIPASITDFLWAPVGLKYHSLHHYFPSIPYHNLKKAHELLLHADANLYLATLEGSFPSALQKAMSSKPPKEKEQKKNQDQKQAA